ncbi:MAG: polysaccharide biosynthesis tyrosine autokinase [Deltaproteobacteria bacterium]|jgi:succinoglycan biosynthesis transport protein ExoP|nr:polysaccharide biosynthesis tyrosine autokinase [Deltaproteobacteria bacterium]
MASELSGNGREGSDRGIELARPILPGHAVPTVCGTSPLGYGGYPAGVYVSHPFDRPEGGLGLRELYAVLASHRRLIGLVFAAVTLLTALYVLTRTPLYTAGVTLQIDRDSPNILTFDDVVPGQKSYAGPNDEYSQTQFSILRSRVLAARVIRKLGLASQPGLAEDPSGGAVTKMFEGARAATRRFLGADEPPADATAEIETSTFGVDARVIDRYLRALEVKPVRNTRLVRVAFTSPLPELAARVADGIADGYKAYSLETRLDLSIEGREFLDGQLHDLEERLRSAEAALAAFRQEHQLVSLDTEENPTIQAMKHLNQLLTDAVAIRIEKEAQFDLVRGGSPDSLPAVLASPLIAELKQRRAELEREYARLSKKYLPDYPQMQQLRSQVEEARASLGQEMGRIARGLEREFQAARERESALRQQVERSEQAALAQKSTSAEYSMLKRDVDLNRSIHDSLLQRMKEMTVAAGLKTGNIRIVDPAEVPTVPSAPRRLHSLALGMLLGLALGVGAALLRSALDNSIRTPAIASRVLGLQTLALVPSMRGASMGAVRVASRARGLVGSHRGGAPRRPSDGAAVELVTLAPDPTPGSEAYKIFRTALLLLRTDPQPRRILFTSSVAGEGKTSTAINTCISLAQAGKTVALVDADLRCPRVHKVVGLSSKVGLSTYLESAVSLQSVGVTALHRNLWVVPGGTLPSSPSELLGTDRMRDAIDELARRFDYVVLDSGPTLPVPDALILSSLVDGVVLVVDSSRTSRELVQAARERLDQAGARMLGVVLNQVDARFGYGAQAYRGYEAYGARA